MRTRVLLFAAFALAACQKAETPEQATMRMAAEGDSAKTIISAMAVRYASFINANQADSQAAMFMDGGMMMPPNSQAVTGRDSIRAHLTREPMPPSSHLTLMTVEVAANGPIAVERGTYNFTMPANAQAHTPAVSANGKYLQHWHKMNGNWQIAAQIWSDDVPAMPMPPAPRR